MKMNKLINKNKPVAIIIFAFISIALGILFSFRKTLPFYSHPKFTGIRLIVWYIGALCFLIAGIGILLLKKWAKNLFLVLAWIWLFNSIRDFLLFAKLIANYLKKDLSLFVISIILYIIIHFAFPIIAIYYFNRKSIKELFKGSTQ